MAMLVRQYRVSLGLARSLDKQTTFRYHIERVSHELLLSNCEYSPRSHKSTLISSVSRKEAIPASKNTV